MYSLKDILAAWQSGYAADCNSVNAGSIPTAASISFYLASLDSTSKLESLELAAPEPAVTVSSAE